MSITRQVDVRYLSGRFYVERLRGIIMRVASVEDALTVIRIDSATMAKRKRADVITQVWWKDLPTRLVTVKPKRARTPRKKAAKP